MLNQEALVEGPPSTGRPAPDEVQRARALALKEEDEAARNTRLADTGAEASWEHFRERLGTRTWLIVMSLTGLARCC